MSLNFNYTALRPGGSTITGSFTLDTSVSGVPLSSDKNYYFRVNEQGLFTSDQVVTNIQVSAPRYSAGLQYGYEGISPAYTYPSLGNLSVLEYNPNHPAVTSFFFADNGAIASGTLLPSDPVAYIGTFIPGSLAGFGVSGSRVGDAAIVRLGIGDVESNPNPTPNPNPNPTPNPNPNPTPNPNPNPTPNPISAPNPNPTPNPISAPNPNPAPNSTPEIAPYVDTLVDTLPSINRLTDLAVRSLVTKALNGREGGQGGHIIDLIVGNKTIPTGVGKKEIDWASTVGGEVIEWGLKALQQGSKLAGATVPWLKVGIVAVEFAQDVVDRSIDTGKPWYDPGNVTLAATKTTWNALVPGAGDAIAGILEEEAKQYRQKYSQSPFIRSLANNSRSIKSNGSIQYQFGRSSNDILRGKATADVLIGNDGNDRIVGYQGFDQLNGTGSKQGKGEVDTLTGGQGIDVFVLGDPNNVYYDDGNRKNSGPKDYALITDFEAELDAIVLKGNFNKYIFKAERRGVAVYLDNDGIRGKSRHDELIAQVQGVNSLDSSNLVFA